MFDYPASPLVASLGAIGVILTALVTWLIAKRLNSGRIDTTEADTLWAEGKAMRYELRAETITLRADIAQMHREATALRTEMRICHAEVIAMRDDCKQAHLENARLRRRLAKCEKEK